jgi:hypothetical protein
MRMRGNNNRRQSWNVAASGFLGLCCVRRRMSGAVINGIYDIIKATNSFISNEAGGEWRVIYVNGLINTASV